MTTKEQELIQAIRKTSLLERLEVAQIMIGDMCKDRRPPKMSIPTNALDEDMYISQTLKDAAELIAATEESEQVALARRDEREKTLNACLAALWTFAWPDYLMGLPRKLDGLLKSAATVGKDSDG